MKLKWFFVSVIFLSFSLNVNALISDLPNSITFFEEERSISFEVENDSGGTQNLNIRIYSPIAYEIKGSKSFLENGEKSIVEVTFFPQEKLLDSVYETTILVELGKEIKQEKISMSFNKRNFCPIEFHARQNKEILELTAKNNSFQKMEFQIKGFKEGEWKIEEKTLLLEGKEEKKFELNIDGSVTGKNFVLIQCTGIQEVPVELQGRRINQLFDATGAFVLGSFGEMLEPLNLVLVIVAAVLLIAFISRLVKRLNEGKK